MVSLIDQPTTRSENRSMTTATCSNPSTVQMEVSAIQPLVGCVSAELPIEEVVGDDRPQAIVLRQPAAPRTRLQAVNTHQPLDAMQAT